MRSQQIMRRLAQLSSAGTAAPQGGTNSQLCSQLSGCGPMDLGVLGIQRDIRQRNQAVKISSAVLNVRNDDLRKIIKSIGDG